MTDQQPCLCGSGLDYAECCSQYHSGEKAAPTAEALMRSRFTAYARQDEAYLLATWDTTTRPTAIDFSKEKAEWQRLEIVGTKKGGVKDSKGMVEFRAYFLQDGEEHVMNEASRFTRINSHWFYLNGVVKSIGKVGLQTNQGKNAPCACGSGKKFKRCCGAG